ncbi:helix-turn-helix transcriptional regulator [Candidatus Dojkabacteria bacterium]|nr:helix-turn-helix transcriptional regulator [Candidatus Dojkabacteria bacterium]
MNVSTNKKIETLRKLLVLNRIKILTLLSQKDTCVCQMVKKLNLKHSLISHHLKTLLDLKYVKTIRNGQHIIYKLIESKRDIVLELLTIINN